MEVLGHAVVGGLNVGVMYALAGASMVIIFRTCGYASFVQGDIAAVSLYVGLAAHQAGLPYPVVALVVVLSGAFAGGLIGSAIVVPLEKIGHVHALLATIAVALVLQGIEGIVVGMEPRRFPSVGDEVLFNLGDIAVHKSDLVSLVVGALVFGAIGIMFSRTSIGVAMRASSDSLAAAEILGVRVGKLRRMSWILGGALAGIAGLFVAPTFALTPNSVNVLLVFAFCAVVVGGMESVMGALVAGIGVGIVSNVVAVELDPNLVPFSVYLVILGVLLVRPQGLFGRRAATRV